MTLWQLFFDYTFQVVAVGAGLLGLISGMLGSFLVLRRQSLLGDGISHATLPGVVLGFLLIGSKNTEVLLLGALAAGLLAAWLILLVTKHTKLHFDAVLAVVLSVFFGLGLVGLTYTQKLANANQAGLDRFIYGQASGMLQRDVWIIGGCGVVLILLVLLFWKEFKLLAFDPIFATVTGVPVRALDLLLTLMMVVAIVVGLQTVGVILMSAMLIAPAVAARQWTGKLGTMVLLSAGLGAVSGVVGTAISSLSADLSTGPVIVVCATILAFISLLVAPHRGIVAKLLTRRRQIVRLKKEGFHE